MKKKKIFIGIIGCGMAGDYHINNLLKIKTVKIKWLCDISNVVLKNACKKYDIPNGTTNYKEVLNDRSIDAVIISTPPKSHYKITNDAISAKKHVLIEKPIAINQEQVYKLYNRAKNNPELIILDCSSRHSRLQPKFQYIKEIIESGKLGHIYYIHHNAIYRESRPGIEYHPNAKWFLNKKLSGGGALIDWGVYDLSFHLGILNDKLNLKTIKSFNINGLDTQIHDNQIFNVEEHGIVLMEFDTNLIYYWERANNAHNEAPNETRIYGTRGGLKFSYLTWDSNEINYYYSDKKGKAKKDLLYVDMKNHKSHIDDYCALDKHFIRCLLYKERPILPLPVAVKHLDIIFKAMKIQNSVDGLGRMKRVY